MVFHGDIRAIRVSPISIAKLKKQLEMEQDIVNNRIARKRNNNNNKTVTKKQKFQRD